MLATTFLVENCIGWTNGVSERRKILMGDLKVMVVVLDAGWW